MKQVTKTAEVIQSLQRAFGADVAVGNYAVFEMTALNNLPIRQKHPLFEGAIAQDSMLREIVQSITTESAPLQLMHDTRQLPAGRVFDAQLVNGEVRALFAINIDPASATPETRKMVSDIDAGIINQVSVNVLAKELLCSECGWNYLGEDANYMNVLNGECDNGHALRADGVHVKMHGLDYLAEISLVGTGGATGARILSKDNQIFGSESFQRLAASGLAPAMLVANFNPTQGQPDMDLNALVADLSTVKASEITLTANLNASTALVAERDATIVTLTAERDVAVAAQAEAVATAAPSAAVLAFIKDAATKAMIASGNQTPTVPDDVEAQIAEITKTGTMLSMIPVGGASTAKVDDVEDAPASASSSAFRRRA
jgi:hypothetical protein